MIESRKLQFLSSFQECCRTGQDVEPLVRKYSQEHDDIPLAEILTLRDSRKRTPLHYACRANHPPITLLLQWFPDFESRHSALQLKDKDGITCLMMAVQHPNAEIEDLLRGTKLGLARSKAGATALHYAAGAGANPKTMQALWKNAKVAIHTFALEGGTPLHWACSSSKEIPDTIQILIECGADVNASNASVPQPLALALAVRNEANICALLESPEIDVEVVRNQTTLFHMAVEHDLVIVLQKMLEKLQKKHILQHKNKNGRAVLDVAIQQGNTTCIELLRSNGALEATELEEEKRETANNVSPPHDTLDSAVVEDKRSDDTVAQLQAMPDVSPEAVEVALSFKSKGNRHFQQKEWQEAVDCYTEAIAFNPKDATFYANRSACFVQIKNPQAALSDGTVAVGLKPDWTKAHYRQAVALLDLQRYHDAALAAYHGLALEPSNMELQKLLRTCVQHGRKAFRETKKI